jgi:hypothetical protein
MQQERAALHRKLPERIASLLSQRHLARFRDHFRRSGIPIMALGRLGGNWFKKLV